MLAALGFILSKDAPRFALEHDGLIGWVGVGEG